MMKLNLKSLLLCFSVPAASSLPLAQLIISELAGVKF